MTVKNRSYIRSYQYKKIIDEEAASGICLFSEKANILLRVIDLKMQLSKVDFSGIDIVILGFLPQLLIKDIDSRLRRLDRKDVIIVSDFFLSLWDTITLDRQYVSPTGIIGRKLKKMDEAACRVSQMVITDTKANADFAVREFGANPEKSYAMYLLPNKEVYNADHHNTKSDSKQPETLSEKGNPFKVLYFGTGLPLQGTDIIVDAAEKLQGQDIIFTLVGNIRGIDDKQSNVVVHKWLKQSELARLIAESDLCLAGHFAGDIDKADRTIPGKAYIYEMMNKPMILGDTRANRELFHEDNRHIFVSLGDSEELAEAIVVAAAQRKI
ncbi:MAG: glycosyltransferase [Butyrivibrio sp.]|nr:glycosyltransferase [Butyrivibrio sp.]